jgi:hypothetical protein
VLDGREESLFGFHLHSGLPIIVFSLQILLECPLPFAGAVELASLNQLAEVARRSRTGSVAIKVCALTLVTHVLRLSTVRHGVDAACLAAVRLDIEYEGYARRSLQDLLRTVRDLEQETQVVVWWELFGRIDRLNLEDAVSAEIAVFLLSPIGSLLPVSSLLRLLPPRVLDRWEKQFDLTDPEDQVVLRARLLAVRNGDESASKKRKRQENGANQLANSFLVEHIPKLAVKGEYDMLTNLLLNIKLWGLPCQLWADQVSIPLDVLHDLRNLLPRLFCIMVECDEHSRSSVQHLPESTLDLWRHVALETETDALMMRSLGILLDHICKRDIARYLQPLSRRQIIDLAFTALHSEDRRTRTAAG